MAAKLPSVSSVYFISCVDDCFTDKNVYSIQQENEIGGK
jgi:hypothetical protein